MLFFPIDNLMETRDMFTRDEHYDASHLNILMYWKGMLAIYTVPNQIFNHAIIRSPLMNTLMSFSSHCS